MEQTPRTEPPRPDGPDLSTPRSLGRFLVNHCRLAIVIGIVLAGTWHLLHAVAPGFAARHLTDDALAHGLVFLLVGFVAQLVDGAMGMAYGITSTTFLLSAGVPPSVASASVHAAEVFTTGISGVSHWRFGNVHWRLFVALAVPGAIGAALGAWLLSVYDGKGIKPYVAAYLLLMGIYVLVRAFRQVLLFRKPRRVVPIALFGGFIDASGGGGWGAVVTSNLLTSGKPRQVIGTVNAAEFVVALVASIVFLPYVGLSTPLVVLGLILGGALAAPLGAFMVARVPHRAMMAVVGLLITGLSAYTLWTTLAG
ncbi:MAG: sulfite exporter TauE/SafE family protein [Flavobacteriales bacterium]|jgi:uncharacterized membrane protein YfcA|nr:sulfite exporter TauE/SafE family protein [Flavobacteriales bacterium]